MKSVHSMMAVALLMGVVATNGKKMIEMEGLFKSRNSTTLKSNVIQKFKNLPVNLRASQGNILDRFLSIQKVEHAINNVTRYDGEPDVDYEPTYFEKDMIDYYDVQLFSKVYVGSNMQPFELILDTGSSVRFRIDSYYADSGLGFKVRIA